MAPYLGSIEHVQAELQRIDLLIRAQVWRARQVLATDEEFQGLVITEEEIDLLLAEPAGLPQWASTPSPLSMTEVRAALDQAAAEICQRKASSQAAGITLRLDRLVQLFGLTSFDLDALLICLAPELDLRYERLYAYLQDDVTKKRPSVDLVLNLLSPSYDVKLAMRHRFTPNAPLRKHHLVRLFQDSSLQEAPLLAHSLKVDERVTNYLLDSDQVDHRLSRCAQVTTLQARLEDLLLPDDIKHRLVLLARENATSGNGLVLCFQGPYGVGKQTTAEALCRELGVGLLVVDGERLLESQELTVDLAMGLVAREALLQDTALYWTGFDALLSTESTGPEGGSKRQTWREALISTLEARHGLTILATNENWEPKDAFHALTFVRVRFSQPAYTERVQLWRLSLDNGIASEQAEALDALANKFRFTGGQIRDAAATARHLSRWRNPENGHVTMADLYAASRLQSNQKLSALARKITPHYSWDDIVLPPDRIEELREICNQVTYRAQVYDQWGFGRKLSMGKGLNVLFAGPSGTGKTMAADIIAGQLELDLYKIDLSTVVSKYIGETEKNLAQIFTEAETSNAILFFDEADALFGKRSEVRDSHDRYANIEISYLLQRMEEYQGVVILATNLHKNMDDAFVRRMHFSVEFPFPQARDRLRIWEKIWPDDTPLSGDLDLEFAARRFEIAGGNIRNIAVAAAFLAAANGEVVTMDHLMHATQRELQKMGKVVTGAEYKK